MSDTSIKYENGVDKLSYGEEGTPNFSLLHSMALNWEKQLKP